jgi:peptide/nickel transport system substrate-binding protein
MFRKYYLIVGLALILGLGACSSSAPTPEAPSSQAQAEEPAAAEAPAESAAAAEPETENAAAVEASAGGGTVRIGWAGSPDTLNPGTAILEEAYILFELVYDTMYELNLDGTFSLSLAESVDVSDDGTVWTYKLRPGITFHDGEPLTASDIVFSYNFYQSHEDFPYLNSYTGYFASVEAPDDNTVVLTLTEPIPNIESQLVFLYVLPEHIWSEFSEGAAGAEYENPEMIGTGPFSMAEYQQNEFVRLEANKDYFLTPPIIDEVIFQTFGNPDALVQAVVTGQVDMIRELPKTAVPTLRNTDNVALVTGAPFSPTVRDVILNQTAAENCPPEDGICSGHPALLDRNVRLALAHATDKQNIIDVALLGLGTPGLTLLPDGLGLWYNDTLPDYEFDIAKANQILDEAGYQDTDGDGVREMPDGGQALDFRLYWPNDVIEAPRIAELLGQTWSQIGVKTQPQALDPDALTSVCCPAFDFDVIIWGWGSDPDPNLLLSVMTTDEIPTGSSETGYSNPEFDALYAQQAVELDRDKRQELVWQMQQIVHDDVVYVIPYYEQTVQAYRTDRFQGWLTDAPKLALEDVTSLAVIKPVQ